MSDRIAVMNRGKIVEIGPAEEVYGTLKEEYTKALLAAVPVPDPRRMRARPSAQAPTCAGRAGLVPSRPTLPALVLVLAACGGGRRLRPPRRLRRRGERAGSMPQRRSYVAAAQVGRFIHAAGGMVGDTGRPPPPSPATTRRATAGRRCRSRPRRRAQPRRPPSTASSTSSGGRRRPGTRGPSGPGREGMAAEGAPAVGALQPRRGRGRGPNLGARRLRGGEEHRDVFVYDTRADRWSRGTPLPRPNHTFGAVALGREIWLLGGRRGADPARGRDPRHRGPRHLAARARDAEADGALGAAASGGPHPRGLGERVPDVRRRSAAGGRARGRS